MKRILILSLLVLSASASFAQFRKYSNEFLNIGAGARELGMGSACVATSGDVYSAYWNPAGLLMMRSDIQLGLMHSEYFAGIAKYDFGSVVVPIDYKKRIVGMSILRFAVDDIPNTLFLVEPDGTINYDNVTKFSAADYAMLLSYAQHLSRLNLRFGGNAKIVHRTVGSFAHSWGFGF